MYQTGLKKVYIKTLSNLERIRNSLVFMCIYIYIYKDIYIEHASALYIHEPKLKGT